MTHPIQQDIADNNLAFTPNRIFYIVPHNLFSTETKVVDLTGTLPNTYTGGDISNELRDAARNAGNDKFLANSPIYIIKRPHWWSTKSTAYSVSQGEPFNELAYWKQPYTSVGTAHITFPDSSPDSTHELTISPPWLMSRTNTWVQDSVQYEWNCDSQLLANRMTLHKKVGGKRLVVARYAQRWGSWVTGGVLLVQEGEINALVAVLTTLVMLRKMQQRAPERRSV
jgi:hypothetical protein